MERQGAGTAHSGSLLPNYPEFAAHVLNRKETGRNGLGEAAQYVSYQALTEIWHTAKIYNVLNSGSVTVDEPVDRIHARCLRVWSILVYISRPADIVSFTRFEFDDTRLPWIGFPPQWEQTPAYNQLF